MTHPKTPATRLLIQQGPSCWLYVVESVVAAKASAKISTKYLRMAMRCYPDGDSVTDTHKAQTGTAVKSRRTIALGLLADNVSGMVTTLDTWKKHNSSSDKISLAEVQKFARRNGVASDAWTDPELGITFEGDDEDATTGYAALAAAFTSATKCAAGLVKLAATSPGDEVAGMLNTGYQRIDHDQLASDAVLSLGVQELPCYISVGMRYTLGRDDREGDPAVIDFTGKPLTELTKTAHALLLVAWEPKGKTDGTLVYKDPNYGDLHLVITLAQFQAMAPSGIRMRPFFATGDKTSALAKVIGA